MGYFDQMLKSLLKKLKTNIKDEKIEVIIRKLDRRNTFKSLPFVFEALINLCELLLDEKLRNFHDENTLKDHESYIYDKETNSEIKDKNDMKGVTSPIVIKYDFENHGNSSVSNLSDSMILKCFSCLKMDDVKRIFFTNNKIMRKMITLYLTGECSNEFYDLESILKKYIKLKKFDRPEGLATFRVKRISTKFYTESHQKIIVHSLPFRIIASVMKHENPASKELGILIFCSTNFSTTEPWSCKIEVDLKLVNHKHPEKSISRKV